jgi:hypothetical protein
MISKIRGAASPTTYTGENRVPAAVALWLVLVLIASARNGGLPNQRQVIALGVGTLIVAAAAAVAPKFVFYALLAGAIVIAAQNSDLIAEKIDQGSAALRDALGGAG